MEQRAITGVSKRKTAEDIVRTTVTLAGGPGFIRHGSSVPVKPNVNSDDPYPATTSPAVVSAVVAMRPEQGAGKVIVGDRSVYRGNIMRACEPGPGAKGPHDIELHIDGLPDMEEKI